MITNIFAYVIVIMLSIGSFWYGAYNKIMIEMALSQDATTTRLASYDLKELTQISVDL